MRRSSDQLAAFELLGDLAPRTVANPVDIALLGSDRFVAKRRRGARGRGKALLSQSSSAGDRALYDLYQEFIPSRREFRVNVLSDRVVSAYMKILPPGTSPDDLHPAWRFERADQLPGAAVSAARQATYRLGLDYAGVDVV